MQVSLEQVTLLEKYTREQADNKVWFQQREGQITASNLLEQTRLCLLWALSNGSVTQ